MPLPPPGVHTPLVEGRRASFLTLGSSLPPTFQPSNGRGRRWRSLPDHSGGTVPESHRLPEFRRLDVELSARGSRTARRRVKAAAGWSARLLVCPDDLVDPVGEFDVVLGRPALRVGDEGELEIPPADVDVRMVVHLLGDLGHLVDDPDGSGKIFGLDRATQGLGVSRPGVEVAKLSGDLFFVEESRHVTTVVQPPQGVKMGDPLVVVGAAILDGGRLLAAQRGEPPALAGGWELPGGKVEPGESEEDALVRECREELGVEIALGKRVGGDWPLANGMI